MIEHVWVTKSKKGKLVCLVARDTETGKIINELSGHHRDHQACLDDVRKKRERARKEKKHVGE